MSKPDLAEPFEQNRAHLRTVALRMLGSAAEAEDAVQEAWLRLHRSDTSAVENLGGWLTTVVARVCLDMLRSRRTRREDLVGAHLSDETLPSLPSETPEEDALLADSVGPALLVVLETLQPAERIAFVLHDMFSIPFEEIATIIGRSPAAARQLASRGRRRIQGGWPHDAASGAEAEEARQHREIVDAFVAASRKGDFEALLAVLDPDVVLRADAAAQKLGAAVRMAAELRGAEGVAKHFRQARGAQPATVDGLPGVVWAPGGTVKVAFSIAVDDGRIVAIDLIADPERIEQFAIEILGPPGK